MHYFPSRSLPSARRTALTVVRRIKERGRPSLAWAARLAGSTVAAYAAATAVDPNSTGITGALTALLVVQLTLHGIVRHGLDRVLSVMVGILVASLLSSITGITWWSLGIAVGVSVLAGQLLRVGPNLSEVGITAMLVLSAGSQSNLAAGDRLTETLIGAAVGVLVNFMFPPGERSRSAGVAVKRYANDVAEFLERAAPELRGEVSPKQASDWLARVRRLDREVTELDAVLAHAEESRRMNVRAINKRDPGLALREGLDSLEHCTVVLRSVFRGVNDAVHFGADSADPYPAESREVMARALTELARTLRAFGALLDAQVHGPGEAEEAELQYALSALVALQDNVRTFVRAQSNQNARVYELNVLLGASIGRISRELSVEGNGWLAKKNRFDHLARPRSLVAASRLRSITRDLATKQLGPFRKGA